MKTCNKCKETKPLDQFSRRADRPSGKRSNCKKCALRYLTDNKVVIAQQRAKYYIDNKVAIAQQQAKYRRDNKEQIVKGKLSYHKRRYKTDSIFALRCRIGRRTRRAFQYKGLKKTTKTNKLLGCTYGELYTHIESLFTEGMTWDNRRKWHIDHIIPLASATNEEELIKLCHYTNLQPLWAIDNLKKGAKVLEFSRY